MLMAPLIQCDGINVKKKHFILNFLLFYIQTDICKLAFDYTVICW